MSDITVASTTDPQVEIDKAAGIPPTQTAPETPPSADADVAAPAGNGDGGDGKKPKSAYQKRIDRLVKERSQAQREVEELKGRLLKLEQSGQPNPTQEQEQAPEAQAQPPQNGNVPPKPAQTDFQTYEEWVEALSDWKMDRKLEELQAKAAEAQAQKAQQEAIVAAQNAYNERLDAAREKYDDFDDVAFKASVPILAGVAEIIKTHPNGADLQYYLGSNPKIAKELSEMPYTLAMAKAGAIAEEFGREVTEDEPSSAAEEQEPAPTSFTPRKAKGGNPPPPIRPVGGSSTKSSVPIDELPYSEYRKIRDQQEKSRYRR